LRICPLGVKHGQPIDVSETGLKTDNRLGCYVTGDIPMRVYVRILISVILFAAAPSSTSVWAQEPSTDTKSSADKARSPAKKDAVNQDTRAKGINEPKPAGLSTGQAPKEFDWSGTYGGMHGGALGSTGQGGP
jgi:hypothetical protein